jgi:hypothetical protein
MMHDGEFRTLRAEFDQSLKSFHELEVSSVQIVRSKLMQLDRVQEQWPFLSFSSRFAIRKDYPKTEKQ